VPAAGLITGGEVSVKFGDHRPVGREEMILREVIQPRVDHDQKPASALFSFSGFQKNRA
jgi:hypothetical protein